MCSLSLDLWRPSSLSQWHLLIQHLEEQVSSLASKTIKAFTKFSVDDQSSIFKRLWTCGSNLSNRSAAISSSCHWTSSKFHFGQHCSSKQFQRRKIRRVRAFCVAQALALITCDSYLSARASKINILSKFFISQISLASKMWETQNQNVVLQSDVIRPVLILISHQVVDWTRWKAHALSILSWRRWFIGINQTHN